MQHETQSRSNQADSSSLPKARLPGTAPILSGKKTPGAVGPADSGAGTLTSRMIDYRSWWNLPRSKSKSKKPQP